MILPWKWGWPVLFVGKLYLSVERFFCSCKESKQKEKKKNRPILGCLYFVFIIWKWVGDKQTVLYEIMRYPYNNLAS